MTDRGLESWTDGRSARERVREVATTLTEPRTVEWIRDQAQVSSRQTTKDELELVVEFGQAHVIEDDDGATKYAPNYQLRYFTELMEMIDAHTQDELREEIATIQTEIDKWKATFSVKSWNELESTLTDADLTSDTIRERNHVLRQWECYADNKRLLKHALVLYEDARELDLEENESFPF